MQISNDNTLAENITINNDNSANANETVVSDGTLEVGKDETGYEGEKQEYEVYEDMRWRVLGLSEDENHILLTSENPMQKTVTENENPYLILQGAEAYLYCEDTLDKICSIYENTELADEVRSIRIEDVLKSNITRNQITKADNQNPTVDEWTNNDILYTDSGTLEGEEGQAKEETIQEEGGMLTLVPMTE